MVTGKPVINYSRDDESLNEGIAEEESWHKIDIGNRMDSNSLLGIGVRDYKEL